MEETLLSVFESFVNRPKFVIKHKRSIALSKKTTDTSPRRAEKKGGYELMDLPYLLLRTVDQFSQAKDGQVAARRDTQG
jgi:hypothetical protein